MEEEIKKEEKNQYEVGDYVIYYNGSNYSSRLKVIKTTKTQATLNDGTRLKIQAIDFARSIGSGIYSRNHYELQTDKNLNAHLRYVKIKSIKTILNSTSGFDFYSFSNSELDELQLKAKELFEMALNMESQEVND